MSEYRTARKPLGGAHLQEYRRNRGPSPLFVHSSSPSVGAVDNDFSDISSDERIVTVRNESGYKDTPNDENEPPRGRFENYRQPQRQDICKSPEKGRHSGSDTYSGRKRYAASGTPDGRDPSKRRRFSRESLPIRLRDAHTRNGTIEAFSENDATHMSELACILPAAETNLETNLKRLNENYDRVISQHAGVGVLVPKPHRTKRISGLQKKQQEDINSYRDEMQKYREELKDYKRLIERSVEILDELKGICGENCRLLERNSELAKKNAELENMLDLKALDESHGRRGERSKAKVPRWMKDGIPPFRPA